MQIGALTEENRQLAMRLENARGKIEVVCTILLVSDMLYYPSLYFVKVTELVQKHVFSLPMVIIKCYKWVFIYHLIILFKTC